MIVVGLLFLLATSHVLSEGNGGNHQVQCVEREKEALLISIKRVVDPGNVLSSWKNSTNQDCCTWSGVTCDNQTNHVIMIDLSCGYTYERDYAIAGEIGSSLVELQHLKYLSLEGNNFSRIPKFIGSFKELTYLNLAGNPVSGTIPPELGNLTNLQFLDLSRDYDYYDQNRTLIADNFAWLSHLTSLTTFTLTNANFTKAGLQSFMLPPSLSSLQVSNCLLPEVDTSSLYFTNSSNFLKTLSLQGNSIHPTAVTWLLNSSINLVELTLQSNIIDGSFPDSFGKKNSLSQVVLSFNEVESGVPKSLGNLTNLKVLDLSCNNLGGTLHDLLENLAGPSKNSLESLSLGSNQLGGLILDDENTFPTLTELNLDSNQLEGPFPNRLRRFPSLQSLSLDDNRLTGPLPDLSSMSSLTSFSARNNKFNSISLDSIGELYHLETLLISSNSLTGVISEVNLRCPKLKTLDLSYNSALALKFNCTWVPSFQLKSIMLTSCMLGPEFPCWLQTQTNLSTLEISNSSISGPVPNWFNNITSKLSNLDLSFNLLNNTLPDFPLICAYEVDLSFNQFHGSIPPSLSNSIKLFLSNNNFTDFRSFLCEAEKGLTSILDIGNNKLSGSLPNCWGNFQFLVVLSLVNNKLSGEIPGSISLRDIQTLQLRNNNLSGNLPSSLKNCTELRVLDLGKNTLKGPVPSWIGERLTSLVFLSLKSNKFYGSIPLNLCHLTEVQILDLSSNNLSGAIPSCIENFTSMVRKGHLMATISIIIRPHGVLGYLTFSFDIYESIASIMWKGLEYKYDNILGLLRIIDLSSNKLTGEIPVEVTHLVQLVQLNLSRNDLNGAIPKKIGNLTNMEALDLSYNYLSGEIPISLAQVSSLNYLDLSNNRLSGRIPTSTQLQSFNGSTYTNNLGLCGLPLTSSCPGDETSHDPLPSTRDDEYGETWFDMSWFYIGIGVGFSVGFCGVCGNLLINTSWRLAYFQLMHSLGDWLYVMFAAKRAALRRKLAWN